MLGCFKVNAPTTESQMGTVSPLKSSGKLHPLAARHPVASTEHVCVDPQRLKPFARVDKLEQLIGPQVSHVQLHSFERERPLHQSMEPIERKVIAADGQRLKAAKLLTGSQGAQPFVGDIIEAKLQVLEFIDLHVLGQVKRQIICGIVVVEAQSLKSPHCWRRHERGQSILPDLVAAQVERAQSIEAHAHERINAVIPETILHQSDVS